MISFNKRKILTLSTQVTKEKKNSEWYAILPEHIGD